MILYGPESIATAPWPDSAAGQIARSYLVPLVQKGAMAFFADPATVRVVGIDDQLIPLIIADDKDGGTRSSATSISFRYIKQQRQAIAQMQWSPARSLVLGTALDGLGRLLRAARIDRCVYVGNWILLRGWEPTLSPEQVERLTRFLAQHFPEHAIVFNAVKPLTHHVLLEGLRAGGYGLYFAGHSRILMPHDIPTPQERAKRRWDGKLLSESGYRVVGPEALGDIDTVAARLAELYRALNRGKYATNPEVTAALFANAIRQQTLTFRLLVRDGRIDGFYANVERNGISASVLFGYDTSIEQERGLYRMLIYRMVQDALEEGLAVELGAGADEFKSLRGHRPVPCFGACHVDHLPWFRRAGWRLLRTYANGPFLAAVRSFLGGVDGDAISGFDGVEERFAPPEKSTQGTAAALQRELEVLEEAIDQAAADPAAPETQRLSRVSYRLNNWPQPTPQIESLKEKLALVERQARQRRKAGEEKSAVLSLAKAQALLQSANKERPVALVIGELGDATTAQLRAAAASVLERATSAAIFFAATHEERALLVAALTRDLVDRGADAAALMGAVAPIVGGRGGGGSLLAFGGGDRRDAIPEAIAAARRYLEERLA